jgi:hypothetical protein
MPYTKTEIANLALSHLGTGKNIADLDSERSVEALACKQMWKIACETLQRENDWPFLTKIEDLTLVTTDPNTEWKYSYRYPTDCIVARRILSGVRNDTLESEVKYIIVRDDTGLLIFTDQEDAVLEYSVYDDSPAKWPPDFGLALSYRLAGLVAPRISTGDPFQRGLISEKLFILSMSHAQANAQNEQRRDNPPQSTYETTRE